MITITIDNKPCQVRPDQNLLQACLSLGLDLPYFCWHPALHSVGACRQCAVKLFKDEHDSRGRIIMSCMTPVSEGMRISVNDPEAVAFRGSVIEWLMLNHPHDCPVCDEGGECHLQDMTVMSGHVSRRNRFRKRTHRNQDLGPFINHEMNRCIQCYRCVRFYRGVAGGRDLDVFACHDSVYFGRHEDGALESPFSGNLVEVCPTGVFTDKTLQRHYTRKWDLQTAPSVCVHCGIGCNIIAGERQGTLRRVLNRYNGEVNGYFLCDLGRFGYEFVNSERRIRQPMMSPSLPPSAPAKDQLRPSAPAGEGGGEGRRAASAEEALKRIADILSASNGIIGIGSPRASLESNFALRSLVGPDQFFSGMSSREQSIVALIIDILRNGPGRTPSLRDVQAADAVLVLGEDVSNTAPLLALAIRQASRNGQFEAAGRMKAPPWDDAAVRNAGQDAKSPVYIAALRPTGLDDVAAGTVRATPEVIADLGFAIANAIEPAAPGVPVLSQDNLTMAREIAASLRQAKRPLVVSGSGCLSASVVQAAANIAWALCASGKPASLAYAVSECNTLGLGLMGGRTLDEALAVMQDGRADTVLILENDLFRRAGSAEIDGLLRATGNIIVIDHLMNPTVGRAHVVLPAATFAEASGTLVSSEGRAQRFCQVSVPGDAVQAGWKWIEDIRGATGQRTGGVRPALDDMVKALAEALPFFRPVLECAPPAGFTIGGQRIPRQAHRSSGRTALTANSDVRETQPPEDRDSPLAFSLEGSEAQPPSPVIPRYWAPGWNSVQALNKFQQEVGGPLRGGDPGVRLLEPGSGPAPAFFPAAAPVPDRPPHAADPPDHLLFGSEELSREAPAITERLRLQRGGKERSGP
jgi:NADH-quinone oxidoreductase subunit G